MSKIKALYQEFSSSEGSLFRYALSFSLLLAIAPSLIIFALLFRFAYLDLDDAIRFFFEYLPEGTTIPMLASFLASETNVIPAITTMIPSFWMASRSIYSFLMISANHEEVDVPKFAIRLQSIILFVIAAVGVVAAIMIGTYLKAYLPLVSSMAMVILFTMLYRVLSYRKRAPLFGLIGAVFATAGILAVAYLYLYIIDTFFHYDTIYGPLGSLVTLLLAIYIIAGILYFGFCLNIVLSDYYQKEHLLPMKHEAYFTFCETLVERIIKKCKRRKRSQRK